MYFRNRNTLISMLIKRLSYTHINICEKIRVNTIWGDVHVFVVSRYSLEIVLDVIRKIIPNFVNLSDEWPKQSNL